jgi:phosphoenolpyruvate carboxylase
VNYKKALNQLVQLCHQHGIQVHFVSGRGELHDYGGVNPYAAETFDFKYRGLEPNCSKSSEPILIRRDLPYKTQFENLKHEVKEEYDMKNLGMSYWPAHLDALRSERSDSMPRRFP